VNFNWSFWSEVIPVRVVIDSSLCLESLIVTLSCNLQLNNSFYAIMYWRTACMSLDILNFSCLLVCSSIHIMSLP
jgi:hypothetical protein